MLALASLYWLIQKLGSFFCIWGGKKKGEGVTSCPASPPPIQKVERDHLPYTPTFATKLRMSFLEVSLAALGPHWKLNSGGSVRGMGVISRYLQGAME